MTNEVQGKLSGQYKQDVQGIARRFLEERDELIAANLSDWPQLYEKSIDEMWADVIIRLAQVLKSLIRKRDRLIFAKENYHRKTHYEFGWGKLPIDEAIAKFDERIARCQSAPLKPPIEEVP